METSGKTVLVVDDEQNIRLMLRTTLEAEGFVVKEATGTREAVAFIEKEMPAVMLLDLWMPDGDGMTVLEHLSPRPPAQRPRVIVLTAHGGVTQAVQAMRWGASDFLEKPTTPDRLRQAVALALKDHEEHSAAKANRPSAAKSSEPDVSYSEMLLKIRHGFWSQDINQIEQILSKLFRKATTEPAYFNLLGVLFEAEGNRGAAKALYAKAAAMLGGCPTAQRNLERLQDMQERGMAQFDVDLGDQADFLNRLCDDFVATTESTPGLETN
jgi:DNA-binding response OmpR family regulator